MPIKLSSLLSRNKKIVISSLFWGILSTVLFWSAPFFADDYGYLCSWTREFAENPSISGIPFDELEEQLYFRFHYDTFRLGNLVFMVLCLLPKWILGLLSGIIVTLILILSSKIAKTADSYLPVILIAAYSYLNMAGWNILLSSDFVFNYFWATLLMIACIWIFTDNGTGFPKWLVGLAGVVTGLWHEGFSAPLICGLLISGVPALSKKRNPFSKKQLIMIGSLSAGLLLLLCVPGMWTRLSSFDTSGRNPAFLLAYGLKPFIPLCALIISSKTIRNILFQKSGSYLQTLLLIATGITGGCSVIAVIIGYSSFPWQFFPVIVPSAIGLTAVLGRILPSGSRYREFYSWSGFTASSVLGIIIIIGSIDNFKISRLYRYAVDTFAENHYDAIFLPVALPSEKPLSQFTPSLYSLFWDEWSNECINYYANPSEPDYRLRVVSDKLRSISIPAATDKQDNTVYRVNGLHVIKLGDDFDMKSPRKAEAVILTGAGKTSKTVKAAVVPFISEKDNARYGQIVLYPTINQLIPRSFDSDYDITGIVFQ